MKAVFEGNNGKEVISVTDDETELWKSISQFLKNKGFTIYYYRMWIKDCVTNVDFGSHTEFVVIEND